MFVALAEAVMEVSDYIGQNNKGTVGMYPNSIRLFWPSALYLTILSAVLTGAKLTLARVLVLLVALGYSISMFAELLWNVSSHCQP